tara:strand:- start:611 stop:1018 length:408 start_codon:yes stop_codon:yes gene_type:complete
MPRKKVTKETIKKTKEENILVIDHADELVANKINENEPETKIDSIVEKTPFVEKQHEMFYNLEEGRINLEDQEREKAALVKAKELEAVELERKNNEGKPKLTCPFCQNIQYDLNSRDVTTSWCMNCGRAFMVNWV